MIYQYSFKDKDIKPDGCYYLDLLKMIEIEQNIKISQNDAVWAKNWLKDCGFIDNKCHVLNPDKVLMIFNSNIRQVGKNTQFWLWTTERQQKFDFQIVKSMYSKGLHNVLENCNDKQLYDSMRGRMGGIKCRIDAVYYTIL